MGVGYRPASEPQRLGEKLIAAHFPDIVESGVRIEYAFRSEAQKSNGKLVGGKCQKVGGVNAWLSQVGEPSEGYTEPAEVAYYLLTFAEDLWQSADEKSREALVHHELMHVLVEPTEDGGWSLRIKAHDVEDFAETVKLYGLWSLDLAYFVKSSGVAELPFEDS